MSRGHRLPPSKWNKNKGGDEEKGGGIAYKQTNKEGCRERERRQTEMTAKSSTRQSSLCSSTPDIFLIFNQKKRENVVGVITIMLSSHLLQFNFLPSVLEMLNTPNDDDDCSDDDDDRWDTTGTRYEQTLIITGTWDAPRQQRTNTLALWFPRFASQ